MPRLQKLYKNKLHAEGWHHDTQQLKAIGALQNLLNALCTRKSFWPFRKKQQLRGVYMYGGVGRGKSMLMDLFFEALTDKNNKKNARRVHFHEFMIETHDWLHVNRGKGMDNLLPSYARHVSAKTKLLCFDEFHVTDVADAMILGRLFTALFDQGVVMVSTSNWSPDCLYDGGLQRELFLPFIDLLKGRMDIVHLDSDTDYRSLADPDQDVYYFHPLSGDTKSKVDALFSELTANAPVVKTEIKVKGRVHNVTSAHDDVARFTFDELCGQALGAEDYIAIAARFDTIFLENVPRLTAVNRNEAKRLILLIDCLYEGHCRLVLSAESDIHTLYDGHDHAFEFDRTISRLMEMQSAAYHKKRMTS